MKKAQKIKKKIRWKENIEDRRYKAHIAQKIMSSMSELLLGLVCMLIFMISARTMLEDIYSWSSYTVGTIVFAFFMIAIVGIFMEFSYYVDRKLGRAIRWGILVIGIFICTLYLGLGEKGAHILSGLEEALRLYIRDWNIYYGSSVKASAGNIIYVTEALDFLFLSLFLVLFWLAKMFKKNIIMFLVPNIVFALELAVGLSPNELGIFLMFAGILLSNASAYKSPDFLPAPGKRNSATSILKNFMWVAVGICIFIGCGVVKLVGASSANDAMQYTDQFKAKQRQIIDDLSNWWLSGDFSLFDIISSLGGDDSTEVELTNDAPDYTGKTVLTIHADYRPSGNLYLKGYYANEYEDGIWELDSGEFEEACLESGYDVDKMSENIASLGANKILKVYQKYTSDGMETFSPVSVTYSNATGTKAFYPYFIIDEGEYVEASGDSRYIKERNATKTSFYLWDYDTVYENSLYVFEGASRYDWESWYEEFVRNNYLKVPSDMSNVRQIAKEIDRDSLTFYATTINEERLAYANAVANWMRDNTTYSMDLPSVPSGVEPVEYFLGNSRKGYCMHYASASVLILRELGVPARYVSGYIVDKELFYRRNSQFIASVPDNRAHAWVEIYLNGVGWVPVEVTKGYDVTDLSNVSEEDTSEVETSEKVTDNTTETSSYIDIIEKDSSNEIATTKPLLENSSDSSGEDINSQTGDNVDGNNTGNRDNTTGNGVSWKTVKLVLIFMGIASVITVIVYAFLCAKANYRNKLLNAIKKKRTLRAIKTINRRIYRKLRVTGKLLKNNPKDEQYEDTLKKVYPEISPDEWEKYMDIVKAAAFSKKDFSVEEMEFCYSVYNRIGKKNCK